MSTIRELDVETCMSLLEEHHFGRVAFDDGSGPMILPVNYVFHRGEVVFRSDIGSKTVAAESWAPAAFEIDHVDEANRVGWSVLLRGRLVEVTDTAELAAVRAADVQPFVKGQGKHHYLRLQQRSITGRVTPLPDDLPPGWYRAAVLGTFSIRDDEAQ
jgi:nitroimidazol reductase NimA-like FMN-containing flavoprotein (pyridoxamine 5'-phosphate oxidase superfamily)